MSSTAARRIRLHDRAREDRRDRHSRRPRTPTPARSDLRRLTLSVLSRAPLAEPSPFAHLRAPELTGWSGSTLESRRPASFRRPVACPPLCRSSTPLSASTPRRLSSTSSRRRVGSSRPWGLARHGRAFRIVESDQPRPNWRRSAIAAENPRYPQGSRPTLHLRRAATVGSHGREEERG